MSKFIVNVGYNNSVARMRMIAVIAAEPSPTKRLREEAKQAGKLIDATNGRKTRSVIVMDSNHVVLSALEPATLAERMEGDGQAPAKNP